MVRWRKTAKQARGREGVGGAQARLAELVLELRYDHSAVVAA